MLMIMHDYWWTYVGRGGVAIVLGLAFLAATTRPRVALVIVVTLFAAHALIQGILSLVLAARRRHNGRWGVLLVQGLVSITVAVVAIAWPGLTVVALILMVALWALASGAIELAGAVALRHQLTGAWLLGLAGLLSIGLGGVLLAMPSVGPRLIMLSLGLYCLLFGGIILGLGLALRHAEQTGGPHPLDPVIEIAPFTDEA